MLVRCPSCQTSVWATAAKPCPSCRKPLPQAVLVAAAAAAPARPAAPIRPIPSTCHDVPLCRSEAAAGQQLATPIVAPEANRTVRRTSRTAVVMGLLFLLGGAWMFTLTFEDNSFEGVRTSRRGRAMERVLGETGTEFVCALVGVGIGLGLIVTSRREVTVAAPRDEHAPAATATACTFCNKQSPDVAQAFLTVDGGRSRPIAFRCQACAACRRESRRVNSRYWTFVALLPLAALAAFPVVATAPMLLFGNTEFKPGAATYLSIVIGVAVALVSACFYLQRQVRRRTASLLGPQVEPLLRSRACVKKWGWPKRVVLRSQWDAKLPIADLA